MQKIYKRVRDASLWKFMQSRQQAVNGNFACVMTQAVLCYECIMLEIDWKPA